MLVVHGVCMAHWHLRPIIKDIKWLTFEFQHINWKPILRKTNFMADALARVALIVANPYLWDYCLSAMDAFNFDCMKNHCIRGFKL